MVPFLLWGGRKVDLELICWSSFSPSSSSPSSSSPSSSSPPSLVALPPLSSRQRLSHCASLAQCTAAGCHFPLVVVVVIVTIMIIVVVVIVVVVIISLSSHCRCRRCDCCVVIVAIVTAAACHETSRRDTANKRAWEGT